MTRLIASNIKNDYQQLCLFLLSMIFVVIIESVKDKVAEKICRKQLIRYLKPTMCNTLSVFVLDIDMYLS